MKKKTKIEELEDRIKVLENKQPIYVPITPNISPWPVYPIVNQCTCNSTTNNGWCPVHGFPGRYIVTC